LVATTTADHAASGGESCEIVVLHPLLQSSFMKTSNVSTKLADVCSLCSRHALQPPQPYARREHTSGNRLSRLPQ